MKNSMCYIWRSYNWKENHLSNKITSIELPIKHDYDYAGTYFITPEGYKLLELYDYDSVTMFYSFVIYPEK